MRFPALLVLLAAPALADGALPGTQTSRLTLGANEAVAAPAPGCRMDVDCKGNRICQAGVCTESAGLAASTLTPLPPPMPAANTGLASLQLRMITNQIQLLLFQRLSLAGPLFATIFGGLGVLVGGVMMPFGYTALIVGIMVASGSALPLAIGLVWLFVNIGYNRRIDQAVEKLRDEQRALSASSPVSSYLDDVQPGLKLASF